MEPNLAFTTSYNCVALQPITPFIILNDKNEEIFKGRALWDTGANCSCIPNNIAQKIGLVIVGENTNRGITNVAEKCDVYYATIGLPNRVSINVNLLGIAARDDFDLIIGMDIITKGEFAISTFKGVTKVSFCAPGRKHVDFVQEINAGPKFAIGRRTPCPCGSGKKYKDCCEKKNK